MPQSELQAHNYIPEEDTGGEGGNPLDLRKLHFWRKKMKQLEKPSWLNMLSWKLKEDVKLTYRGINTFTLILCFLSYFPQGNLIKSESFDALLQKLAFEAKTYLH